MVWTYQNPKDASFMLNSIIRAGRFSYIIPWSFPEVKQDSIIFLRIVLFITQKE